MSSATGLSLVNQKLAYCRGLLRLERREAQEESPNQRLNRQALLDGTLFHLACAYRHYLRELAETYSLPNSANIISEEELLQRLERQGKSPSEARELKRLKTDQTSWLSQLNECYAACWQEPEVSGVRQIQVVDLESGPAIVRRATRTHLDAWLAAFTELLERQRSTSAEF